MALRTNPLSPQTQVSDPFVVPGVPQPSISQPTQILPSITRIAQSISTLSEERMKARQEELDRNVDEAIGSDKVTESVNDTLSKLGRKATPEDLDRALNKALGPLGIVRPRDRDRVLSGSGSLHANEALTEAESRIGEFISLGSSGEKGFKQLLDELKAEGVDAGFSQSAVYSTAYEAQFERKARVLQRMLQVQQAKAVKEDAHAMDVEELVGNGASKGMTQLQTAHTPEALREATNDILATVKVIQQSGDSPLPAFLDALERSATDISDDPDGQLSLYTKAEEILDTHKGLFRGIPEKVRLAIAQRKADARNSREDKAREAVLTRRALQDQLVFAGRTAFLEADGSQEVKKEAARQEIQRVSQTLGEDWDNLLQDDKELILFDSAQQSLITAIKQETELDNVLLGQIDAWRLVGDEENVRAAQAELSSSALLRSKAREERGKIVYAELAQQSSPLQGQRDSLLRGIQSLAEEGYANSSVQRELSSLLEEFEAAQSALVDENIKSPEEAAARLNALRAETRRKESEIRTKVADMSAFDAGIERQFLAAESEGKSVEMADLIEANRDQLGSKTLAKLSARQRESAYSITSLRSRYETTSEDLLKTFLQTNPEFQSLDQQGEGAAVLRQQLSAWARTRKEKFDQYLADRPGANYDTLASDIESEAEKAVTEFLFGDEPTAFDPGFKGPEAPEDRRARQRRMDTLSAEKFNKGHTENSESIIERDALLAAGVDDLEAADTPTAALIGQISQLVSTGRPVPRLAKNSLVQTFLSGTSSSGAPDLQQAATSLAMHAGSPLVNIGPPGSGRLGVRMEFLGQSTQTLYNTLQEAGGVSSLPEGLQSELLEFLDPDNTKIRKKEFSAPGIRVVGQISSEFRPGPVPVRIIASLKILKEVDDYSKVGQMAVFSDRVSPEVYDGAPEGKETIRKILQNPKATDAEIRAAVIRFQKTHSQYKSF